MHDRTPANGPRLGGNYSLKGFRNQLAYDVSDRAASPTRSTNTVRPCTVRRALR